jgi:hypothetical protein
VIRLRMMCGSGPVACPFCLAETDSWSALEPENDRDWDTLEQALRSDIANWLACDNCIEDGHLPSPVLLDSRNAIPGRLTPRTTLTSPGSIFVPGPVLKGWRVGAGRWYEVGQGSRSIRPMATS